MSYSGIGSDSNNVNAWDGYKWVSLKNLSVKDNGLNTDLSSSGTLNLNSDTGTVSINSENTIISGNLVVNGTATTVNSENVAIEDRFLNLGYGNTVASAVSGGITVTYLPVAPTGAASNFTTDQLTVSGLSLIAGDFVMISGCSVQANNGIFEVLTYSGSTLTINTSPQPWAQNVLTPFVASSGTVNKINLAIIRCGTDGKWEVASGSNVSSFSFVDLALKTEIDGYKSEGSLNNVNVSDGAGGWNSTSVTLDNSGNLSFSGATTISSTGNMSLEASTFNLTVNGYTKAWPTNEGAPGNILVLNATADAFEWIPQGVPLGRTLTAGAGLTGGGDLSADRTFNIGANADGSITVNANDIQVGVLATDAQHGLRGGGTQHAVATTSVSGFMSAADKTKLDGVATGATNTPLTNSAPANVTKAAAVIGVSSLAARADHKHDITTAAAVSLSGLSTNTEGTSTSLARADHTHNISSFLAAAPPTQITVTTAAVGTSTDAARADHVHSVSTAVASSQTPGDLATAGTATSLARSDHKHALPAFGTTLGTIAQGNDSRFTDDRTASGLRTATTIVAVNAATAPSAGQVLTATSDTAATWQTPTNNPSSGSLNNINVSDGAGGWDSSLAFLNTFGTLSILGGADPQIRLEETAGSYLRVRNANNVQSGIDHVSSSGTATIDVNCLALDGVSNTAVRLFRSTNTTGTVVFDILKGNNTTATNHRLSGNSGTGSFLCNDSGTIKIGSDTNTNPLYLHNDVRITSGTGSPEGVLAANIGSTYSDASSGFYYVKVTGTGNTGWQKLSTGPTSSTDRAIAIYNGTTGDIQNSAITITAGNIISGVTDPVASSDVATKNYVDTFDLSSGWKQAVRVATTANITLSATQTIDGIALAINDRVLVKNQTTTSQNGVYLVQSGAWTRSTDTDTGAKIANMVVAVEAGTTNADTVWKLTTVGAITVGSTGLTYSPLNLTSTAPSQITVATASAGTAVQAARRDHVHSVSTAAPITTHTGTTANAVGTATSLARSDHTHNISGILTSTAASQITVTTATAGVATAAARQDHVHSVSTAAPTGLTAGGSNSEGVATSLARSDHVHSLPAFGTTAGTFAQGNDSRFLQAAGFDGYMQYNNNGVLGGAQNIIYDDISGNLTIGHLGGSNYMYFQSNVSGNLIRSAVGPLALTGQNVYIQPEDVTTGTAYTVTVTGGNNTGGAGREVKISGGTGTTNGGGTVILGANGGTAAGNTGGNINLTAGNGNIGGNIVLTGGSGNTSTQRTGEVILTGGANYNGTNSGRVLISGGDHITTGAPDQYCGHVEIRAGNNTTPYDIEDATFHYGSNLILSSGNSSSYLGGGGEVRIYAGVGSSGGGTQLGDLNIKKGSATDFIKITGDSVTPTTNTVLTWSGFRNDYSKVTPSHMAPLVRMITLSGTPAANTNFTLTAGTTVGTWAAISGNAQTIPSTGVYMVSGRLIASFGAGIVYPSLFLYNTTTNSYVANLARASLDTLKTSVDITGAPQYINLTGGHTIVARCDATLTAIASAVDLTFITFVKVSD